MGLLHYLSLPFKCFLVFSPRRSRRIKIGSKRNAYRALPDTSQSSDLVSTPPNPCVPSVCREVSHSLQSSHPGRRSTLFRIRDSLRLTTLEFVPQSIIDTELTESAVRDILVEEHIVDDIQARDLAQTIVCKAHRLFAILVASNNAHHIRIFLERGIHDEDLPFKLQTDAGGLDTTLQTQGGRCILMPDELDHGVLDYLQKKQWEMIAPVFRQGDYYNFPKDQKLPFIISEPWGRGGFGKVSKKRIHPLHHDFGLFACEGEGLVVAVKQLCSKDPDSFNRERACLKALGEAGPHLHLIYLLCTYSYQGQHHLMFPYADANLRQYWNSIQIPDFDDRTFLWCLRQMRGIVDGLSLLHKLPPSKGPSGTNLYGRHGDLKAANILWFKSYPGCTDPDGVLQIADLGLARYHQFESKSNDPVENVVWPSTYSPPRHPGANIDQLFDIWGLGCLLLEFVTWMVRGDGANEQFSQRRGREGGQDEYTDDVFYDPVSREVRPSVRAWAEELKQLERCTPVLQDLLDLIMNQMLQYESFRRSGADSISLNMNEMYEKARTNQRYLLACNQVPSLPRGYPILSSQRGPEPMKSRIWSQLVRN